VLFVIRTLGSPFATPPSRALATTTLAVVAAGAALPFTPLAARLGFTPLPASFFLFLAVALVTYLVAVELVKRRLVGARGAAWRRVRRATA